MASKVRAELPRLMTGCALPEVRLHSDLQRQTVWDIEEMEHCPLITPIQSQFIKKSPECPERMIASCTAGSFKLYIYKREFLISDALQMKSCINAQYKWKS